MDDNYNTSTWKSTLSKLVLKEDCIKVNDTTELLNYTMSFNPLGGKISRARDAYIKQELDWYKSMSLNIKGYNLIENNPIWKGCATKDGNINSNYGWCIWSKENHFQYSHAVEALLTDKDTRQSCCIYVRPEIQDEHNDGIHATHDFICTFQTHHLIRDDHLHYIVNMRSNDIMHGTPYDLEWHRHVYSMMYYALQNQYKELYVCPIIWNVGSLHLYDRDREEALLLVGES
jgi:thymidylate synthase